MCSLFSTFGNKTVSGKFFAVKTSAKSLSHKPLSTELTRTAQSKFRFFLGFPPSNKFLIVSLAASYNNEFIYKSIV